MTMWLSSISFSILFNGWKNKMEFTIKETCYERLVFLSGNLGKSNCKINEGYFTEMISIWKKNVNKYSAEGTDEFSL